MDKVIIAPVGNILTTEDVYWLSGIIIQALRDGEIELNLTSVETLAPSTIYQLCGVLTYAEIDSSKITIKGSLDRMNTFKDAFSWQGGPDGSPQEE